MRVGYFGTWETGYPRNEQVISALEQADVDVVRIHRDVWRGRENYKFRLGSLVRLVSAETALATQRVPPDVDVLLVGYPGHFDLWSAKRHRRPVVFNAMVSLYDTLVNDRRRVSPRSAIARALRALDRAALRAAHVVVADTAANARFLADHAGIATPHVCYVGAEDRLFRHLWRQPDAFSVLFVGKLIPLHGVDVILDAARRLPDVPFRVVGTGQCEELLADAPANVAHVPWIAYDDLPAEYARAGCALGVFGSSDKARRVIPNKAFQALAVGAPLVTAATDGVRELLTDGVDSVLTPPTGEGLADAIAGLRDDPRRARDIAERGRATYEAQASEAVLGRRWRDIVSGAHA